MPGTRADAGRGLRKVVPRSSHASWEPSGRPSVVRLLEESNRRRLPDLVPIRDQRMQASPFAFLRGSPAVMAHDLATTPTTGITVQASGDAHLLNFGLFATPERNLVFGLNDFDETCPGRGSGMSSAWRPAWWWPGERSGSTRRSAARRRRPRSASTGSRWRGTPGCGTWTCGTRGWKRPPWCSWPGAGGGRRWPTVWPKPSITPTWRRCPG
jgi:Uncharacterized protein conserved in bacteria (DUF2252)